MKFASAAASARTAQKASSSGSSNTSSCCVDSGRHSWSSRSSWSRGARLGGCGRTRGALARDGAWRVRFRGGAVVPCSYKRAGATATPAVAAALRTIRRGRVISVSATGGGAENKRDSGDGADTVKRLFDALPFVSVGDTDEPVEYRRVSDGIIFKYADKKQRMKPRLKSSQIGDSVSYSSCFVR